MKRTKVFLTTLVLSATMSFTALAGQWQQDNTGYWYQNDDGGYPVNQWQEIDGKQYYFGGDGYMLHDTTTPDGYTVGTDGALIITQTGNGTRENPYNAFLPVDFSCTYKYLPDYNYSARLQLLEIVSGIKANETVFSENMFNKSEHGNYKWKLYHFQLTCLSSAGDYISGSLINPYNFFNQDSTIGLSDIKTASLGKQLKDRYSVKLYPGGTDDFWIGVLIDDSIPHITFKIDAGDNGDIWFTTQN